MTEETHGKARSVHTRLVEYAKNAGLDSTLVFTRYGIERFLFRLSESPHADRFVLKGALLLMAWLGENERPTRDIDLLGSGDLSDAALQEIIRTVCAHHVADDGMRFDPDTLRIAEIRDGHAYGGKRATLTAYLGRGRIKIQIDIGIGDTIEPAPATVDYPTLLGPEPIRLVGYSPESVVAEKLHAIVHLGMVNTRLKDYYDLLRLTQFYDFKTAILSKAVHATFERRGTVFPTAPPVGLTPDFATAEKSEQWTAFLTKNDIIGLPDLATVSNGIVRALGPHLWDRADDVG